MQLECDIGNSGCKWRLREGERILERGRIDCSVVSHSWHLPTLQVSTVKGCSVAKRSVEHLFEAEIKSRYGASVDWAVSSAMSAGVCNAYKKPASMGVDRWSVTVAAFNLYGACVVIDAGSALTVDLVDTAGQHLGGFIAPGAALMAASLLRDTANVRFECSSVFSYQGLGKDTGGCVSGAIKAAQIGVVSEALKQADSLIVGGYTIVITGGGADDLVLALDNKMIKHPDLVLDGLKWLIP